MAAVANVANVTATRQETVSSTTRITKEGKRLSYQLTVIQQPERARACGSGAKSSADRRPVDPPPIVALRVFEGEDGAMQDVTFSYKANFFLFATLESARPIAHGRVPQTTQAFPVLTGMFVSGMAYLDRPMPAGYFLFPDLSVRHEGKYRLSFNLYEETKDAKDADAEPSEQARAARARSRMPGPHSPQAFVDWRLEVKSKPFTVFSAKKFPGLAESTSLSRIVAEQGCRVRIRRDVRMRRRGDAKPTAAAAAAGFEDEHEDEDEGLECDDVDRAQTPATNEQQLGRRPSQPPDPYRSVDAGSADPSRHHYHQSHHHHHHQQHQQHHHSNSNDSNNNSNHLHHHPMSAGMPARDSMIVVDGPSHEHKQQKQQKRHHHQHPPLPVPSAAAAPAPAPVPAGPPSYGLESTRRQSAPEGNCYAAPPPYPRSYPAPPLMSPHATDSYGHFVETPTSAISYHHSSAASPTAHQHHPYAGPPAPSSHPTMSYVPMSAHANQRYPAQHAVASPHGRQDSLDHVAGSRRPSVSGGHQFIPSVSSTNAAYGYSEQGPVRPSSVVGRQYVGPGTVATATSARRTPTPGANDHPLPPLNVAVAVEPRYASTHSSSNAHPVSSAHPVSILASAATEMTPYPRPSVSTTATTTDATTDASGRPTKRPYGAVFDASQFDASLRDGMRPNEAAHGAEPLLAADDDEDAVAEAHDMLRLRMQYKRADGTEISRRPPSTG
ncbi:MAG: velvet protein [Lichina confinis]|nr:MAG: velvet protein [Lichina confinis]